MTATILDGRAIAAGIRAETAERADAFCVASGRLPTLAAVLVGDDAASAAYARAKARAAEACGIAFQAHALPSDAGTDAVVAEVARLCADPLADAVIVELPLPAGYDAARVRAALDPARDADGVTPTSLGKLVLGDPGPRPATAQAVMTLLAATGSSLRGARAVVIGRSASVGKPLAILLVHAHATVTIAHTKTRSLAEVTREADILVCAAGSPGLIRPEHVRPGAIVIDVGTTMVSDAAGEHMVGDVDPGVRDIAGSLSPVPGGVGPVTTAVLLRTAVQLATERFAARGG